MTCRDPEIRERERYTKARAEGRRYGGRNPKSKRRQTRRRGRTLQRARREASLCIRCGAYPPVEGGSSCVNCLETHRISDVSEEGSSARLTDSKTGPRTIWLGPDAAQLVSRLPRDERAVRIFPEALTSGLLYRFWCEVREQAGLSGLRIHDCRHTCASQGVINGVGLPTVGRLLGHRSHRTTAIYAHLDDAALRDAAAQTSLVIAGAMRFKAKSQSDNKSSDSDDELQHRPEPEDEQVTCVRHPEHDPLVRKIRVLPADASTKKAAKPKRPAGFFRI